VSFDAAAKLRVVLRRFLNSIVISLGLTFLSITAWAEPRVNLGLGYGNATQEFGDLEFTPQSIAGHLDLNYRLWIFLAGVSHMTTSQLNIGEDRNYTSLTSVHAGLALGKYLEMVGGVGWGKWRRRKTAQLIAPIDSDYSANGPGYMAGIRFHLLHFKSFSIGLSATYYRMESDSYNSELDGIKTVELKEGRGTGSIAAIVFSWSGKGKSKK
jgi:hypothetical protein